MDFRTAPSFFLLNRGKNPATVRWTVKDRLVTLAVLALEREKCPHCGVPVWHGQTADERVEFAVEWAICYGCAEKADATKNTKAEPGEWAHVHAVVAEGEDRLPSRAEGLGNIAVPLKQGGSAPQAKGPVSLGD